MKNNLMAMGIALVGACGGSNANLSQTGSPTSSNAPSARRSSESIGAPARTVGSTLAVAQNDALALFDANQRLDEALAGLGVNPLEIDPSRPATVFANGKPQRVGAPADRLAPNSALLAAHEQVSELSGMRDTTMTLEVNGVRMQAEADPTRSSEEKAYVDFFSGVGMRLTELSQKYWTDLDVIQVECRLVKVLPAASRVRAVTRAVLELGAQHGLRGNGEWPFSATVGRGLWRDEARLTWITEPEAKLIHKAREIAESDTGTAAAEVIQAQKDLAEIGELHARYRSLFEAAFDVILKRLDAGEPISPDLESAASSLAQAIEFTRQLRADPDAAGISVEHKNATLRDINDKLPLMREAFCAQQTSYVSSHGAATFSKAAAFLCRNKPPELSYRGDPVDMSTACSEAYGTPCSDAAIRGYERQAQAAATRAPTNGASTPQTQRCDAGHQWCGSSSVGTCCAGHQVCCKRPNHNPFCAAGPKTCGP